VRPGGAVRSCCRQRVVRTARVTGSTCAHHLMPHPQATREDGSTTGRRSRQVVLSPAAPSNAQRSDRWSDRVNMCAPPHAATTSNPRGRQCDRAAEPSGRAVARSPQPRAVRTARVTGPTCSHHLMPHPQATREDGSTTGRRSRQVVLSPAAPSNAQRSDRWSRRSPAHAPQRRLVTSAGVAHSAVRMLVLRMRT